MKPRHATAALLAALLAGSLAGLASCARETPPPPPPRPVKLITVGSGAIAPVVELAGEVRARVESRPGFRIPGKIVARSVEAGQHVRRGEALARVDPRDYQLAKSAADAHLAARRADAENAQAEHRRFTELRRQGYVSDQEVERRRVALSAAESALSQAVNGAALEKNRVDDTVLRADADGVVVAVLADVGDVMEIGAPVLVLAQDGPREIAVEFPEDRAPLARGAQAEAALWSQPATRFPAKLREFAASADPVTRTFRARYTVVAPAGTFTLGQSATLRLSLPARKGGIRIPTTALAGQGDASFVWRYDPATAQVKRTPVMVVGLDGNDAVIAGLPDGAQVVVAGTHVLLDGQHVRPLGKTP